MKNDSYLTKTAVEIPQFKEGGEYRDDQGNEYKVLCIDGDFMEAKFNYVTKKFRIIKYGSVMAAVNSGRVWFKSAKNDPSRIEADESCNITTRGKYNKLTGMSAEEKRAYRRERARKRRMKRRAEAKKVSINNSKMEHN